MILYAVVAVILLFVLGNLIAISRFNKSQSPQSSDRGGTVTKFSLLYDGLRKLSLASRNFIRQAYGDITLRYVILVVVASVFSVVAFGSEYGFLRLTFADVFGETPETPAFFYSMQMSSLFACLIVGTACIAGLFLFDGLGSVNEAAAPAAESGAVVTQQNGPNTAVLPANSRKRNFYVKLAAANVLIVMAILQLLLGLNRGQELLFLANLQEQISGVNTVGNSDYTTSLTIVNAVLAFLSPFLTAVTARYLLTLATWAVASACAIPLALTLWLPTWVVSRIVIWQQRRQPQPAAVDDDPPPLPEQPSVVPYELDPPSPPAAEAGQGGVEHVANARAAWERAEEDQQRLHELEEAERRRREQANANPFGV